MSDNIKLIMENWRRTLNEEEPSMEYQRTPRQEYPEVAALIDRMNQNPRGYRFVDGSQVDPNKPVANEEDIFDKYASNWLDSSTMFKSLAEYERLLASDAYDDSFTKAEKELFTMFFQMSSDVMLNEQPQSNNIKSQKENKQVNNNDMNLIMENFRKIKNSAKKLNMGQLSETLRLHENPKEREPMDSVRELEPPARPIEREPLDSVSSAPGEGDGGASAKALDAVRRIVGYIAANESSACAGIQRDSNKCVANMARQLSDMNLSAEDLKNRFAAKASEGQKNGGIVVGVGDENLASFFGRAQEADLFQALKKLSGGSQPDAGHLKMMQENPASGA